MMILLKIIANNRIDCALLKHMDVAVSEPSWNVGYPPYMSFISQSSSLHTCVCVCERFVFDSMRMELHCLKVNSPKSNSCSATSGSEPAVLVIPTFTAPVKINTIYSGFELVLSKNMTNTQVSIVGIFQVLIVLLNIIT